MNQKINMLVLVSLIFFISMSMSVLGIGQEGMYKIRGLAVNVSYKNPEFYNGSRGYMPGEGIEKALEMSTKPTDTEQMASEKFHAAQGPNVFIEGHWRYFNDTNHAQNIKNATVELVGKGMPDYHIAWSQTDESGHYYFDRYDNGDPIRGPVEIYVKVFTDNKYVKVTNGNILGISYWGSTDSYVVNNYKMLDYTVIDADKRGAWSVYGDILDEILFIKKETGWSRRKIEVYWPNDNRLCGLPDGTYMPCWVNADYISIPAGWEWHREAMLHEYGHAVMFAAYGYALPSPIDCPSPHFINSESNAVCAIVEGWAEFMQSAVDNDANMTREFLQFDLPNIEYNGWWTGQDGTINNTGDIVEGAVASILWDIYDSGISFDAGPGGIDDDGMSGNFDKIWSIIAGGNPSGIGEFWDHWFARGYGNWAGMAAIFEDHGIDKCPDNDGDLFDSYTCGGTDCDDSDPGINPLAAESCNGRDDDCDSRTDEGFDQDGDSYTTCGGDCNDNSPDISPGERELCDGLDNDCDSLTDEGCTCRNGGTRPCGSDTGECKEGTQTCSSGAWGPCLGGAGPGPETCPHDGRDNDCDGEADEIFCGRGYCYDWKGQIPDDIAYYIDEIAMGHYCANEWHRHDIDGDGYDERYLIVGEWFRTWLYCLAQEATGYTVYDIADNGGGFSYGCTYSGGTASDASRAYCDSPGEYSYHDQIFSEPQARLSSLGMFCYTDPPAPFGGYGWDAYELNWVWGDGHREYLMYLRCGTDGDCPSDEYCYKPSPSDPLTYHCKSRCGNGICDPGEICPQDGTGPEICDGLDSDCNGAVDDVLAITCSSDSECPPDGCYSGTYRDFTCQSPGSCDSLCTYSTIITDSDSDGYDTECDSDCDDSGGAIHPGAPELCDERDNNCNDDTDEGCLTACYSAEDCGPDGFMGGIYCQDNDIYRVYRTYTCSYPGRTVSFCSNSDSPRLMEDCGETTSGAWTGNYCDNGDVKRNRTVYLRGCSTGSCYENETPETNTVECPYVCTGGGCAALKGDCNLDCRVDISDLAAVGLAYGSRPGDPEWNENADLNGDGETNIFDLAAVGLKYGDAC